MGNGLKLRERGKFKVSINEKLIHSIQATPPSDTRAVLRAQILEDIKVKDCYWSSVSFMSALDKNKVITFGPRDTAFTESDLEKIFSTEEI